MFILETTIEVAVWSGLKKRNSEYSKPLHTQSSTSCLFLRVKTAAILSPWPLITQKKKNAGAS